MRRLHRHLLLGIVALPLGACGASGPTERPITAATVMSPAVHLSAVSSISPTYGHCARDDRGSIFTNRPGSGHELVPTGAISVTVCRYNGVNPIGGAPDWALRAVGATNDQAVVALISSGLDSMTVAKGTITIVGPADDGSADLATFRYRSGGVTVVSLNAGDFELTNGQVSRDTGGAWAQDELTKLPRPVKLRWATIAGRCAGRWASRCTGPATGAWSGGDPVVVTRDGRALAIAYSGRDGRFRVQVAVGGDFMLRLTGPSCRLIAQTRASARVGQTTTVTLRPGRR